MPGGLHPQKSRPRVQMQTKSPALVAASGATPGVLLGSQRLSSSKGQTRRETGTQSYGPRISVVARPPKGWAGEEPVRPRACKTLVTDLGTGYASYVTACPAFSHLVFLSWPHLPVALRQTPRLRLDIHCHARYGPAFSGIPKLDRLASRRFCLVSRIFRKIL